MPRPKKTSKKNNSIFDSTSSYLDKIEAEVQSNQSRVSYVLGALILIVVVVLLFNYFNKNKSELGSAQNTQTNQAEDVDPDKLPGNYTVKDGDTLFTIAEKYYQDGFKFPEIAKANNMVNVDSIQPGQVITIPKLEGAQPSSTPAMIEPSPSPSVAPSSTPEPTPTPSTAPADASWGATITQNTYIVVEGDWLSTIAARAYNGDILAYKKLAEVNKIPNPDLIYPGQVITIPR